MPADPAFSLAIVGRPNVGKSTLFNRLVGRKLALVDDRPGVTRDRREGRARLGDLVFRVIDTAGLEESDPASLEGRMWAQTQAAIAGADAVLFMVDVRAGLTPTDESFADVVRRSGKPVVLVANKAEGGKGLAASYETFALGLGDPVPLSAEHGEGLSGLHDAIAEALPGLVDSRSARAEGRGEEQRGSPERRLQPPMNVAETEVRRLKPPLHEDDDADRDQGAPLRLCVVGRPNSGKSTLVNAWLGADRLLTGPEAGITRDSIAVDLEWRGHRVRLFDTAGLRRKARVQDKLEKLSVADALRAVRFAEVVIVLLDATIPFEKQDLTIADLVEREGRGLVLALNKWDLVADQPGWLKELRQKAERLLPQIRGCPVVPVSGLSGAGLEKLMEAVFRVAEIWNRRVSTAQVNRWLEGVLANHPPPAVSGRRIKLRYATQAKARPPHFALFGNQLSQLPDSYTRYLVNSLRDTFDLPGVPIRLSLRTGENPFDRK